MEATSKSRKSSKCREWERERRNKFNDAIAKLGEVVKAIDKASGKIDKDHMPYAKVEILQKAIICLKTCVEQKTQLETEVLALRVKLKANNNTQDASTQVSVGLNGRSHNCKYKLMVTHKAKCKKSKSTAVDKQKPLLKENTKKNVLTQNLMQLPMLLPRSSPSDKKENTIVVLPAAPYIFPQRPLLFPTVPPTFLIVDPNVQPLKKSNVPIVNRNSGDITKTTMVNILPISAYSRPLSATKSKKNNMKSKSDIKKLGKKLKNAPKGDKEPAVHKDKPPDKTQQSPKESTEVDTNEGKCNTPTKGASKDSERNVIHPHDKSVAKTDNITTANVENVGTPKNLIAKSNIDNSSVDVTKIPTIQTTDLVANIKAADLSVSVDVETIVSKVKKDVNNKIEIKEVPSVKETATVDKDNKMTNILDTSLCENTVDGGNARLELAEELLAESPTAAFLMTFPLVSGNRADSPADESQNAIQSTTKDNQRRNQMAPQHVPPYLEKSNANEVKSKTPSKTQSILNKPNVEQKFIEHTPINKQIETKTTNITSLSSISTENPFLNLPMPSLISTNCTVTDSTFNLDFDIGMNNISKSIQSQSNSYPSNSNLFYKSDPFSTVKNTIYSTSSISSGHEFNSLGLYPCAMEKYTSKNKSEYANVEDNLMKIGSSRLTYDIDLGWSHKSFDFVNCTTNSNTFNKDILTNVSTSYSTSYNPFNPEFHVPPLVSCSSKKDICNKPTSSFSETMTNFFSQSTSLWSEEVPFYTNNSTNKSLTTKHQNYLPLDHIQTQANTSVKTNITKEYETKQSTITDALKISNVGGGQQINNKYSKKSPTKMHINWMTSEIRPMQNNCNPTNPQIKEPVKPSYNQLEHGNKKQDHNDSNNYFPISVHNFSSQAAPEEFQVWPSARPLGTTEISIEPPPINLPTLVGDLALGPHDKKKTADISNRGVTQTDIQNCSNFFSVTQLMNRSNDMTSRYQGSNIETPKSIPTKQNITHYNNDSSRKTLARFDSNITQPCYLFNEPRPVNPYDHNMAQFSKTKANKADKSSKILKNNYSAESLIRGGGCTQKVSDSNNGKLTIPPQKYNDFNTSHETGVAQVSHYPPILDYTENNFTGQQLCGTTLYNSTTNTISNSFYSNLMSGSSNLMSSNYTSGPFTGDYFDYNQTTECNYTNHKLDELKLRNNPMWCPQDKAPQTCRNSRRESAKHKLECSKKESSKKYQNKKPKLNNDADEWSDTSHLLWPNKSSSKRHPNLTSEELPLPNFVGNQMTAQYQPEFFNSLMSSNVQSVGHNVDRSLTGFPVTSRANFNLSALFPEITMKVQ